MDWYQNPAIMTFLGVLLGSMTSFGATIITARIRLKELVIQQKNELERTTMENRIEIFNQMILLTNTEFLENLGEKEFKNESYLILAKARIYCSENTANLYEKFIESFIEGTNDQALIEEKLLPAIKKDLKIE